jgi:uncharacterized membrane protein YidH (DUF202 family)
VTEGDDREGTAREIDLARERTDLAWNRSGLAVAAAVTIVVRRLWPLRSGREVITLALIAAGALMWAMGMWLSRRLPSRGGVPGTMGKSGCRLLTLGTVVLAVAALVGGVL